MEVIMNKNKLRWLLGVVLLLIAIPFIVYAKDMHENLLHSDSCTVSYYEGVDVDAGITDITDWIVLDGGEFYLIDIDVLSNELISEDDRIIIGVKVDDDMSAEYMSDTQRDGHITSKSVVYLSEHDGIQIRYYSENEQVVTVRSIICEQ